MLEKKREAVEKSIAQGVRHARRTGACGSLVCVVGVCGCTLCLGVCCGCMLWVYRRLDVWVGGQWLVSVLCGA